MLKRCVKSVFRIALAFSKPQLTHAALIPQPFVYPEFGRLFSVFEITIPTLTPIFLMIALGWALQVRRILPEEFFAGLNVLTFYIGLPALLLVSIATSPVEPGPALRIFYVIVAATAAITLLAYPLARMFKLDGPGIGAFMQASMRGNLAYIGLPVLFYALDSGSGAANSDSADLRAVAMLVLAPLVPLYNIACVIILAHHAGGIGNRPSIAAMARKVATNPLLIACLLGLIIAATGIGMPATLVRTLRPLGQMALPLALLAIGASFTRGGIHRHLRPAIGASLLKVALAPLLGLVCARILGLPPTETKMALIFLACPTAVTSYIMAEQMGADADLAGGAVVASTLLSFVPLALILLISA